jgi:NTE family protein
MTKNTRMHRRMTLMAICAALIGSIALAGCEYVRPTLNAPLEQWNPQYGYRFQNLAPPDEGNSDSLFFVVAFSGGGTRASTLAFGALRELARQRIVWEGQEKRLLDELDVIYALSGGTFTGAYYALFGDRIFKDFEYRFLRKDWESELKARIFTSPSNWIRLWSPYYGRVHIMADLLDEALFDGKTYGDLVQSKKRPGLLIHASDMATLARFEFLQTQFDMMCSDMSQLPIAYASAASAALPLVLSPITLKNYTGQCGYEPPSWLLQASTSPKLFQRTRAKELLSYLDAKHRPHVHLLDGGLSDNVALRGLLEGVGVMGGLEAVFKNAGVKQVKKLVILSVNAETIPDVKEYRSDEIPVVGRTVSSLIDIPINRYSADTLLLTHFAVEMWLKHIRSLPPGVESALARDADIYFIDANLGRIDDTTEQEYLMKIPTTLYLTDEQIDRLLVAASRLIYKDPEFQRLIKDLQPSP